MSIPGVKGGEEKQEAGLADVADHLGHPEGGLQALAKAHTLVEQRALCNSDGR
jgi:hypothetical protein